MSASKSLTPWRRKKYLGIDKKESPKMQIKQLKENQTFFPFSCAGGVHGNIVVQKSKGTG